MPAAPHIKAIVEVDDQATRAILKIMETLEKLANTGTQFVDRMLPDLSRIETKMNEIGAAARKAFDPNLGKRLDDEMTASVKAMDKAAIQTAKAMDTTATRTAKAMDKVTADTAKAMDKAALAAGNVGDKLNRGLDEARGKVGRMHEMFKDMAATATLIAGFKIHEATTTSVVEGANYEQEKIALKASGASEKEQEIALRTSEELPKRYPSVNRGEVLAMFNELRGSIPDNPQLVASLVEQGVRTEKALAVSGYDFTPHDLKNLVKTADQAGRGNDPAFMNALFEGYVKAKQNEGDFVNSDKFVDFIQNAKASGMVLDEEYLTKYLPAQLASSQAPRLGNSVDQALKNLAGGTMSKATAQWAIGLGLADPEDLVKTGPSSFRLEDGVTNNAQIMTNPNKWVWETLLPALERSGKTDPKPVMDEFARQGKTISEEEATKVAITRAVYSSGLKGTVIQLLVDNLLTMDQQQRDLIKNDRAMGLAAGDLTSANPIASMKQLMASLTDFGIVLTNPIMTDAAAALDSMALSLTDFTASMAQLFKDNPELGKLASVAGIGGGVLAGGALMVSGASWLTAGPALNGSAAALTASAIALDGAAVALGGGAVAGGVSTAGAAAAGGGTLAALRAGAARLLGPVGVALGGATLLDWIDPKGDLWGTMKALDEWAMKTFGVNPSNLAYDVRRNSEDRIARSTAEERAALKVTDKATAIAEAALARRERELSRLSEDRTNRTGNEPYDSVFYGTNPFIKIGLPGETPWNIDGDAFRPKPKVDALKYPPVQPSNVENDFYPGYLDRQRRIQHEDMKDGADMEAQRGKALGGLKATPVDVNVGVTGDAEVHQSISLDFGLDGRSKARLDKVIAIGLSGGSPSRDVLGTHNAGSQGARPQTRRLNRGML